MSKNLVIVESPAKARTLEKYLGGDFVVKASMGHLVDLPKRTLGIDVKEGFRPDYEVIPDRKKTLTELKKAAKGAAKVFLAPDPDREGEAIAYHLKEQLGLEDERVFRVTFNEITKRAVQDAFKHPGKVNMDLVNAQQARRLLDRLVGYKLSPLLWQKITMGLSAGRVQSVAVRLIADREREIAAFRAEEYWKAAGLFGPPGSGEKDRFLAELRKVDGRPAKIPDGDAAEALRRGLLESSFTVSSVTEKERAEPAKSPFNTSLLQQQASIRLRFSAKRTMMLAQQLYEGIELGDQGPVGLITYMRTDSFRVADEALKETRAFVASAFGPEWIPATPNVFKARKGAQAAHEAIRPTDVTRTPDVVKPHLKRDQWRLYKLIWDRFVSSQMVPARWAVTEINVEGGPYRLQARGRRLLFAGHLSVWGEEAGRNGEEAPESEQSLPRLTEGQALDLLRIDLKQSFTQPPARFTEASLVKTLEKEGIGRPSTYAPIISTIQERGYVKLRERKFHASEIGSVVTELLVHHFPRILEVDFTSQMEDELDRIEEAEADWIQTLDGFYSVFDKDLDRAKREMPDLKKNPEPSGETCPECGGPLLIRINRHGRFLGCANYPKCRTTVSLDDQGRPVVPVDSGHACNLCGKPLLLRTGRRGAFLGCSGYPECRNTVSLDAEGRPVFPEISGEVCEKCSSPMLVKSGRRGSFLACSSFPACRNTRPLPGEEGSAPDPGPPCEKCGAPMVVRFGRRGPFAACSAYPECKSTRPLGGKDRPRKKATSAESEPEE